MGPGPFTVFASTNEAFADLPKGRVETLPKPETHDKLVSAMCWPPMRWPIPSRA